MRSYTKSNPEKSVSEPKPQSKAVEIVTTVAIKDAGTNYKKEDGVKSPKSFFVIVSGGEIRERDYFKVIMNQDKFERIKIKFIANPNLSKKIDKDNRLQDLFETATSEQERYKSSLRKEDEPDKIYIVSDVDDFINDLLIIQSKCDKSNIQLIVNNSCFEVWLYYSRFSEQPTDFKIPEQGDKISSAFKRYLGSKVEGGIDPRKAIFNVVVNIANAKSNYQKDENRLPKLFSTNMFLLAEQILPFIGAEIEKIADENAQRIATHKNTSISPLPKQNSNNTPSRTL
ncbi:MAG: RloB family protein [Bacteroidales bacterium]|jgi:hypothetical protein|nr:RloB family protein [Bacteroidales bacterium]